MDCHAHCIVGFSILHNVSGCILHILANVAGHKICILNSYYLLQKLYKFAYIVVILNFVLKVAQYIKFELPVLQSFIAKLQEEEEREMQKLKKR